VSREPISADMSFEDAYGALEAILAQFEGGQLGLEDSVSLFKDATELLFICRRKLESAQRQVAELMSRMETPTDAGDESEPTA
jgi:exodeoxyribonuclease VII small subunit